MTKDTNLFQDAWSGWVNFVREVTSFGPPKKSLKPKLKPRIMVPLKRDLKKLRRPQPEAPKRTKVEIRKEKTKLKREAVQQVPELKVDPPKPFLIDPKHLETPEERKIRIEKKKFVLRAKTLMFYYKSPPEIVVCESWFPESEGSPPGFFERY